MAKIKVQAQHLKPGDIVGSGEKVEDCYIGAKTPKGKVAVILAKANSVPRMSHWGKYTMIGVERAE